MSEEFEKRYGALAATRDCTISGGLKGVEKESLRIDGNGLLSQAPHPNALGSALTNRFITTDFSEALLEFVTPAFASTWETPEQSHGCGSRAIRRPINLKSSKLYE